MKAKAKLAISVLLLLGAASCGKTSKFVYFEEQRDLKISMDVKVKEVIGASGVDLLWVIDNSGSMGSVQKSVIDNAQLFMQEFVKNSLEWKLGLISTDVSNSPYLGMRAGDEFDYKHADPVGYFRGGVSRLGTSGSGTEQSFLPILKQLQAYPTFLRRGMPLAVVVVTDAPEQSDMRIADFMTRFQALVGKDRPFYAYGAFGARDFGCEATNDAWSYAGSAYEALIKSATAGKAFPLCTKDFGKLLAEMGREISEQVSRPVIFLKERPKPTTIQVLYRGLELKPGPREAGGLWYYDYGMNAVYFYSLEFASLSTDSVQVAYDRDDGLPVD